MSKTPKIVFIAHPIAGNVKKNMRKVLAICAQVHKTGVIPIAPYLVSLRYLKDEILEDRAQGIAANHEHMRRKFVDEVWLYGDRISSGMQEEIRLANEMGIPVIKKSVPTKQKPSRKKK